MSGKSALCQLLHNRLVEYNPHMPMASEMDANVTFSNFFSSRCPITFDAFLMRTDDRVLLIDEAQCTYEDSHLWNGVIKNALEGHKPGLKLVLLSAYGSYDIDPKHQRSGTPIAIPPHMIFSLPSTTNKPGLQLIREELDEMLSGSVAEKVADLVWVLCSGHIGIAWSIIEFLSTQRGNKRLEDITEGYLKNLLRSRDLLHFIQSHCRGIPTLHAFNRVVEANNICDGYAERMETILKRVSFGELVQSIDKTRTPGGHIAVDHLIKHAFLFEDLDGHLQFASQLHLKVWLHSNRTDSLPHLLIDSRKEEFLRRSVGRMSSSRLRQFAQQNHNDIAREKQIQMELYRAVTTCLTQDVL
ncbi:hypothetical protein HK102_004830, partial [Quaeritorhiza haematococci]